MRGRTVAMVFLLASAAGLVALYATYKPPEKPQMIRVAVARKNLRAITVMARSDIEPQEVHESVYREEDHFKWPSEDASDEEYEAMYEKIIDRTITVGMIQGDLISNQKLADKGAGGGLQALLGPGMRGRSIDLTSASSNVAGLIMPGNYVDIIATVKGPEGDAEQILEFVKILAVDQWTRNDQSGDEEGDEKDKPPEAGKMKSVTVELRPEQVLTLAKHEGTSTITLSLRNPGDPPPDPDPDPDPPPIPPGPSGQSPPEESFSETTTPLPGPREPEISQIRTLRNVHWGSVRIIESGTTGGPLTLESGPPQPLTPSQGDTRPESTQSGWIVEASADSFAVDVIGRSKQRLVVVLYWADWCPFSGLLGPMLEKMVEEHKGEFSLVRFDVDQSRDITKELGIRCVPSLIPYKNGQKIGQTKEGIDSDERLREWLDELISSPMVARPETSERT